MKECDRRLALDDLLKGKKGDERALPGSNNKSAEVTTFVLFFVTFAKTIGKSMEELEIPDQSVGVEVINQSPTEVDLDGVWNPRVNPPWIADCNGVGAEGSAFGSLHSNFRPEGRDPPEDIALEDDDDDEQQLGELCHQDCGGDLIPKAISPSSFMKWALGFESQSSILSIEQYELEREKARIVAKAQIDLGFHVLKTMRKRKLRNEAINYKAMIEACGRCSIAHRATDLMEMMSKDGLTLDQETYFSFISAFSNGELFFPLIHPLSARSFPFLAENEAVVFHTRDKESSSDLSTAEAARSTPSATWTNHVSTTESFKDSLLRESHQLMEGFHALGSSLSGTKQANKSSRRAGLISKPGLTKKKHLLVPACLKPYLDLSHTLLEELYPGLNIDLTYACPKCSQVLSQDHIIQGWNPRNSKHEYSSTCHNCKHNCFPKFSVTCNLDSFEGSQGKGGTLHCDYLSPWVLLREVRKIVGGEGGACTHPVADKKAAKVLGVDEPDKAKGIEIGIDGLLDPKFREGNGINATLWWNIIVAFRRFQIPYLYLLQGSYKNQLIAPSPQVDFLED